MPRIEIDIPLPWRNDPNSDNDHKRRILEKTRRELLRDFFDSICTRIAVPRYNLDTHTNGSTTEPLYTQIHHKVQGPVNIITVSTVNVHTTKIVDAFGIRFTRTGNNFTANVFFSHRPDESDTVTFVLDDVTQLPTSDAFVHLVNVVLIIEDAMQAIES